MANFFDQEDKSHRKFSYMDGFRFGLGQFVGWLVGVALVGGVVWGVLLILGRR